MKIHLDLDNADLKRIKKFFRDHSALIYGALQQFAISLSTKKIYKMPKRPTRRKAKATR